MTFDDMNDHWESMLAGDIEPSPVVLPENAEEELDEWITQFFDKPASTVKLAEAKKRTPPNSSVGSRTLRGRPNGS